MCSDTPGEGQWVNCEESTGSTNPIVIDLVDVTITAPDTSAAVSGVHEGPGPVDIIVINSDITTTSGDGVSAKISGDSDEEFDINITVGGGTITTTGPGAKGVYGNHSGSGDIDINATSVVITTEYTGADGNRLPHGIYGEHSGTGSLDIEVIGGGITTKDSFSDGVAAAHAGESGDVTIHVQGAILKTESTEGSATESDGIEAVIEGAGVIDIDVSGATIETAGSESEGITTRRSKPGSEGAINVDVTGGTRIETSGAMSDGIYGSFSSDTTGDLFINVRDSGIETNSYDARGIDGVHSGDGDIVIDVRNSSVAANSTALFPARQETISDAIRGFHTDDGDVRISVTGGSVTTKGTVSMGIFGYHSGTGDVVIHVQDATVKTESIALHPRFRDTFSVGVYANHLGTGNIDISVTGGSVETEGVNSHGILAYHRSTTDLERTIDVTVDGGSVTARGMGANAIQVGSVRNGNAERAAALGADGYRMQTVRVNGPVTGEAAGVYLAGGGRVYIGPRGTIGAASGIAILATGDTPAAVQGDSPIKPKLYVDMRLNGRQVMDVIGNNWILNDDGETTIAVNSVVLHDGATGNTDRTAPNGAWNVTMRAEGVKVMDRSTPGAWIITPPAANVVADRDFSAQDFTETVRPRPRRPAPPPPPMPQTVMVDEPVFGDADEEAGVHLPAGGRVVIGPTGTVGGESGIAILAEGDAPMLHVDLTLDGRRVMDVIGDDWIMNDGGETTIVVNDVTLHEGATGVVEDAEAPNGAFNVTMRPEGVTVDRTDPANWVITEPAAGVVADRDFSTEDFIETSTQPMFTEEYAPRAALYELLPDFLLRLTGPSPGRRCGSTPDSSVWTRVAGGQGAYESDRSTTGATYDLERFEAEGGLSASLGKRAKGWVSVRHVQGTAGVASPTGGGEIDVRGLGSSVGGSWRGANDMYAVGCFSYLAYDVDFASTQQGVLKAGVDGQAYTLDLEVGRRYAVGEQWHLTPRVWVVGSRVSVDDFTDAVDARVSLSGADRVLGGLGVLAETARPWGEGEFSLRGSLDFERMLSGATTTTQVSGEQLSADATENSLLVGLQGVYRQGRFTVGAEIAARQELGSTDSEYTGFLNLGISF